MKDKCESRIAVLREYIGELEAEARLPPDLTDAAVRTSGPRDGLLFWAPRHDAAHAAEFRFPPSPPSVQFAAFAKMGSTRNLPTPCTKFR